MCPSSKIWPLQNRGPRGETITEVLVSVLIAGLALLMLATVIATVSNIVNSSGNALDDYYAANNDLAVMGASSTGGTATIKDGGTNANWLYYNTPGNGIPTAEAATINGIEYESGQVKGKKILIFEKAMP